MVYTERADKCISPKDNNNNNNNKSKGQQQNGTHNVNGYSSNSGSSSSSSAWSKKASQEDKWKYNDMVKENRDKFNSLHFC